MEVVEVVYLMEGARNIELFGKEIPVRKYGCKNCSKENPVWIEVPRVNIFIQITNKCNASCDFCIYHNNCNNCFDVEKLGKILHMISLREDIDIGKLNFTGGEPTLDKNLFEEVMDSCEENIDIKRKPEVTLNTNGFNLFLALKYQNFLDSIGLSHHHYSNNKNFAIFNSSRVASNEEIAEFVKELEKKEILQLRCNLIKGYIDSYEEIIKYMNAAINLDVHDCGFVTLTPNNQYCINHQIDFSKLVSINKDLIRVNSWNRLDDNDFNCKYCECANYIYSNEEGNMCKFYARLFCRNDNKDGILVYDGKYLRHGFGGEIIV